MRKRPCEHARSARRAGGADSSHARPHTASMKICEAKEAKEAKDKQAKQAKLNQAKQKHKLAGGSGRSGSAQNQN